MSRWNEQNSRKNRLFHLLRIRRVEERIAARYQEQKMRCPTHLSIGEEAIAVGVSSQLQQQDKVFSNHRAHAHYLAKGGSLKQLIAELYGKADGCCGGRGGSMHLTNPEAGFIASTPIVGGTVPLAAGLAWSMQLQQLNSIAVVYFGEGCFEQGVMHETMNFAALKKLPLVMVCENNQYAVMTPLSQRQPDRPIVKIAEAHGMHCLSGDGNDVEEVAGLAAQAVTNARNGVGAYFLEFSTHRWPEHCGPNDDDELGYRQKGELEQWKQRCPIQRQIGRCLTEGDITPEELEQMELSIKMEIDQAFVFAEQSQKPDEATVGTCVFA